MMFYPIPTLIEQLSLWHIKTTDYKVKMMIRTRFAPSPTGYLHIGSVRTALFAWLYARKMGGEFILRIEDTDRERSTEESVSIILEGMAWLNLNWDKGPIHQMDRLERYHEVAEQLIQDGHAYRCYCSKDRLENLRQAQMAKQEKPRYDGRCRHGGGDSNSNNSESYVVRFKTPLTGEVSFFDHIHGQVHFNNEELDDVILLRTDGIPTYNFSVVVDDMDMAISHVIRGDDHVNNTPRQIHIYQALGAEVPEYAHVPLILGEDGKRLSKRHGAVNVLQYRQDGYLPEALLNYLVRLGWSHGDEEIFSLEDMVSLFDLKAISKSAAHFNPQKLLWLNQHYLKTLPTEQVAEVLKTYMTNVNIEQGPQLNEIVQAQAERSKTLLEMAEKSRYFYSDDIDYDQEAVTKHLKSEIIEPLKALQDRFKAISQDKWKNETVHQAIIDTAEQFQLKLGKLAQPLRVALTGNTVSPPIDTTVRLIGRERVMTRIENSLTRVLYP